MPLFLCKNSLQLVQGELADNFLPIKMLYDAETNKIIHDSFVTWK